MPEYNNRWSAEAITITAEDAEVIEYAENHPGL